MSRYWWKMWIVAILRVRKDVTLLGEKRDVAIIRVRKDVTLMVEKWEMAILNVPKDVTLLRERGNCYTEGA